MYVQRSCRKHFTVVPGKPPPATRAARAPASDGVLYARTLVRR